MSDKTEYSRLLLKRTGISGEVPTIPPITATTLNEFNATDLFVGEMYVNTADDLLWVRTDSGILPISLSGSTGTTIPDLLTVLSQGNTTGAFPIVVSSGSTIQYLGLNTGSTTTILGLDASGNTITTAVSGATQDLDNVLSYGNSTGAYDIVVSSGQTIQYLGINSGSTTTILGLDGSGNTITTTIIDNDRYITGGTITYINSNGTLDLFDNSGNTISITGLTDVYSTGGTYSNGTITIDKNDGTSFNVSGLFTGYTSVVESITTGTGLSANTSSGNVTLINTAPDQVVSLSGGTAISTSGTYPNFTITNTAPDQVVSISGGTNISVTGTYPSFAISATGLTTPDLSQVLAQGNTTNGNDIIVSTGDTITSPNGENEIYLQSSGNMGLQSTYSLGGNNYVEQIKMRAPSPTDAGLELSSYDSTNLFLTKTEYRPISITDYSFDNFGSYVSTMLEYSGFTIDLTNTTAGYFKIKGLLLGTADKLLGLDSNQNVVPYTIPLDIYSTGGTFSAGTITINRNDGNSFNITGITAGVSSVNVGTGLSGNSTTGDITLINTAPDQVVSISGGTGITTGGTYPNFTITNSSPDQVVSISGGTGITTGGTYPNFTLTNTIVNGSFGITIDGGGSAITTGVKGYITIPYNCTITGWDILADVSGSIVVDVWKDTYANFPPTSGDTIAGSEKPTLSSAVKNQDNSLSTWTTSVSSGDIIAFNVDSASTLTRVNLTIKVLKTS
jgi:hypothetical protein